MIKYFSVSKVFYLGFCCYKIYHFIKISKKADNIKYYFKSFSNKNLELEIFFSKLKKKYLSLS